MLQLLFSRLRPEEGPSEVASDDETDESPDDGLLPSYAVSLFPALEELQISTLPPLANIRTRSHAGSSNPESDIPNLGPVAKMLDDDYYRLVDKGGGLCRFLVLRAKRGFPKLRKLHVQMPVRVAGTTPFRELLSKSWLTNGAESISFDALPPWEIVESD